MVVRSLDVKKTFRSYVDDKELFNLEVPYLISIGPLTYLKNNTQPYITFVISLLARVL